MATNNQNNGEVTLPDVLDAGVDGLTELAENMYSDIYLEALEKNLEAGMDQAAAEAAATQTAQQSTAAQMQTILPWVGLGLSAYDIVENGANPGNVSTFMAGAVSMYAGPVGWTLMIPYIGATLAHAAEDIWSDRPDGPFRIEFQNPDLQVAAVNVDINGDGQQWVLSYDTGGRYGSDGNLSWWKHYQDNYPFLVAFNPRTNDIIYGRGTYTQPVTKQVVDEFGNVTTELVSADENGLAVSPIQQVLSEDQLKDLYAGNEVLVWDVEHRRVESGFGTTYEDVLVQRPLTLDDVDFSFKPYTPGTPVDVRSGGGDPRFLVYNHDMLQAEIFNDVLVPSGLIDAPSEETGWEIKTVDGEEYLFNPKMGYVADATGRVIGKVDPQNGRVVEFIITNRPAVDGNGNYLEGETVNYNVIGNIDDWDLGEWQRETMTIPTGSHPAEITSPISEVTTINTPTQVGSTNPQGEIANTLGPLAQAELRVPGQSQEISTRNIQTGQTKMASIVANINLNGYNLDVTSDGKIVYQGQVIANIASSGNDLLVFDTKGNPLGWVNDDGTFGGSYFRDKQASWSYTDPAAQAQMESNQQTTPTQTVPTQTAPTQQVDPNIFGGGVSNTGGGQTSTAPVYQPPTTTAPTAVTTPTSAIGNSGDNVSTSVSQIDPMLRPHVGAALDWSNLLAQTPMQYYPEQTVAGFTPDQLTGQQMLRDWAAQVSGPTQGQTDTQNFLTGLVRGNNLDPAYFGPVAQSMQELATGQHLENNPYYVPAANALMGTAAGDYLNSNPYLQESVDAAMRDMQRNYLETTAPELRRSAMGAGAYGGARMGIAEGLAKSRLQENMLDTASQMYQQNYEAERQRQMEAANSIQGLFQSERQAQLQNQNFINNLFQSERNAQINAANMLPGVSTAGDQRIVNAANALSTSGASQQALNQAAIQAAMDRWNFYQNEPFNRASWYMNYLQGSPSGNITQTASTANSPSTNSALQWAAIAAGALPYLGDIGSGISSAWNYLTS